VLLIMENVSVSALSGWFSWRDQSRPLIHYLSWLIGFSGQQQLHVMRQAAAA
jgi:hypothetical protein